MEAGHWQLQKFPSGALQIPSGVQWARGGAEGHSISHQSLDPRCGVDLEGEGMKQAV